VHDDAAAQQAAPGPIIDIHHHLGYIGRFHTMLEKFPRAVMR
jgi:hypothetical protein